jgi:hypothetical protein
MAGRALQMLVLVGVACLLVGQGQAANPSKREPVPDGELIRGCVPVVAFALTQVTIPETVQALTTLTREYLRGRNTNIFEFVRDNQRRQLYLDFVRGRPATNNCNDLRGSINGQIGEENENCGVIIDTLLTYYYEEIFTAQVEAQLPAEAALVCILLEQANSQR